MEDVGRTEVQTCGGREGGWGGASPCAAVLGGVRVRALLPVRRAAQVRQRAQGLRASNVSKLLQQSLRRRSTTPSRRRPSCKRRPPPLARGKQSQGTRLSKPSQTQTTSHWSRHRADVVRYKANKKDGVQQGVGSTVQEEEARAAN